MEIGADFDAQNGLGNVLLVFDDEDNWEEVGEKPDEGAGDDPERSSQEAGEAAAEELPEKKEEPKQAPATEDPLKEEPKAEEPAVKVDMATEMVQAVAGRLDAIEQRVAQPAKPAPTDDDGGTKLDSDYNAPTNEEFDANPAAATQKMINAAVKKVAADQNADQEQSEATRAAMTRLRTRQEQSYTKAVELMPAFDNDPDIRSLYKQMVRDPRNGMDPAFPERFARQLTEKYPDLAKKGPAAAVDNPTEQPETPPEKTDGEKLAEAEAEVSRLRRVAKGAMHTSGKTHQAKTEGPAPLTEVEIAAGKKMGLTPQETMEIYRGKS